MADETEISQVTESGEMTMPDRRFKLAPHVVCRQTSSDLKMLFDRDKGVMYELNESASAIIENLDNGPVSIAEICVALTDDFDGSEGEIRQDVAGLMDDFVDANLVAELD